MVYRFIVLRRARAFRVNCPIFVGWSRRNSGAINRIDPGDTIGPIHGSIRGRWAQRGERAHIGSSSLASETRALLRRTRDSTNPRIADHVRITLKIRYLSGIVAKGYRKERRRERGKKDKEKLLWGSPSTGQNHVHGSFDARKSPPHRKIPATAALLFLCKSISVPSNSSSPVVIMVRMSGSGIPVVSEGQKQLTLFHLRPQPNPRSAWRSLSSISWVPA